MIMVVWTSFSLVVLQTDRDAPYLKQGFLQICDSVSSKAVWSFISSHGCGSKNLIAVFGKLQLPLMFPFKAAAFLTSESLFSAGRRWTQHLSTRQQVSDCFKEATIRESMMDQGNGYADYTQCKQVLLAVDESPESRGAVIWAARSLIRPEDEVLIFHAIKAFEDVQTPGKRNAVVLLKSFFSSLSDEARCG